MSIIYSTGGGDKIGRMSRTLSDDGNIISRYRRRVGYISRHKLRHKAGPLKHHATKTDVLARHYRYRTNNHNDIYRAKYSPPPSDTSNCFCPLYVRPFTNIVVCLRLH